MQREFIKKTAQDLFRVNEQRIQVETILNILEDIANFFDNRDEEEYETSQQYIGMKEIFRTTTGG